MWGCFISGTLLTILGVLTILALPWAWKRSQEVWVETAGTITESRLEEGSRKSRRRNKVSHTPCFDVRLAYSYGVQNEKFTGEDLAPRQPKNDEDKDESRAVAASYPIGDAIPVFHHPSKPAKSRLAAKEPPQQFWFDVIFGLLYLFSGGMAIAFARWLWRQRASPSPAANAKEHGLSSP
jgi:hypothetical protein